MQLIPAIDLRGGKCVRLRQGDYNQETIFGDDPVTMAQRWADEGAQRLHLVDLDGARAGKPMHHEVIGRIVRQLDIPCQVGGGIRDQAAVDLLLGDAGADRVIVGTQALKNPEWFREMVELYPGRIALGIDAKNSQVATAGWLDVSSVSVFELAQQYVGLDIAAVIYTNIANDGMMQGIDQATLDDFVRFTELGFPVIASGGVTTLDDVRALTALATKHPKLIGAITGRAIYEGTINLKEAMAITDL